MKSRLKNVMYLVLIDIVINLLSGVVLSHIDTVSMLI